MKLSIIFPVLNQHELARNAMECALKNLSGENEVDLVILDNGSDLPFIVEQAVVPFRVVRYSKSIGVYPTFWEGLKYAQGDVLAFFHTDLMINEKGWDNRLLQEFSNPKVGLIGFIGSNEIDSNGGRGYGTTSNFQGMIYTSRDGMGNEKNWQGSPAEAHGKRNLIYSKAAVVDGCAMIFKKETLEKIKQREGFPPHHFYDRILSCEVRELGYQMGVLGIGCDHISGQTVSQEPLYNEMAKEWARKNIDITNWVAAPEEDQFNWDSTIYREAERQWLSEYRDIKHLVPCKV